MASNGINSLKDRYRVSIHIWDHIKLEMISELRNEQFGSDLSLLSFSSKPDDNFILIVSHDKPKSLLVIDWKRQEIIYSIIVSMICFEKSNDSPAFYSRQNPIQSFRHYFIFDTIEWIGCVSQQHLHSYNINWNSKPLRVVIQHESEVQVTIDFY